MTMKFFATFLGNYARNHNYYELQNFIQWESWDIFLAFFNIINREYSYVQSFSDYFVSLGSMLMCGDRILI